MLLPNRMGAHQLWSRAMKIRFLLVMSAFLSCGQSFGADNTKAQSNASATASASLTANPAPTVKAKTEPKGKAKPAAKTGETTTTKKTTKTTTTKKTTKTTTTTAPKATKPNAAAIAAATDLYKRELAEKIVRAGPAKVYWERPQALLRSVVVLEFLVAADGKLLKSAVRRSNHDRVTEATALASLRETAPLPKPPAILVRHGPIKLQETWLFNKDGRFQVRSTAQQQVDR